MAQFNREYFERNRTYNYVTRTPEQFDAGRHIGEEPRGLLGSAWDNLWGGMEGMVGGLADTAGTMLKAGYEEGRADERGGLLGKWLVDRAIDLNQHAAENARRSGVRNEYSDMGILDRLTSPSYLFDPRGLTAEVSNMTGSMVPFMLMSAAMPEFGAAGVAGLIGRGLSRIGANKIAGLFEPGGAVTGFLRDGFRWAPTGVVDAAANAGEVAEEMRRQGYTNAQIADRIGSAMSYELPHDVVSQVLFGGFLGGKGVRKFAEGGGIGRNIAANTVLGGFEALNEAGQEFVQTQAVEQALGKPVGTFMNPTDEERRAFDAAFIGTLPMVAAGGARNVTKNWLRGKAESAQSELQSSAPVKTSGDENIDALIAQAAEKYGVPVNLLHSIAQTESGYNQGAKSEAGAIGMMQLMPDTAAGLGVDPNDLAGNIEGGAKYLREMLDTFDDDVEKAVAAYNAGPNAVKQHGGIPPFEETQDYVRKVMGGLDGYDASVPQRVRSLIEDATPFLGVTMDNGENGCVEAVTKIGAKSCPFLAQELSNGVVNVDRLVADAGNNVIPFDPNQLEEGDVIVYGDESDPQRHVVLYDGKGGYIGNSTEQNKVVQGADYNAMGTWAPTKIIKTGAQFGGAHSAAPVMPDFTGLIADETNIKETQEAIQKLIDTDTMTPEQHAAILQAAEMARDTPIGSGTDPAAEAESVNEWQRLIDRKDAKGIFEKDPKRIVQHLQRLEKTQKMQRTRAAIENQQQIEATKQALATVLQAQNAQNAQAVPTQGDASIQQIVPEQPAQPMMDGQVSPIIPQAGDMQGANAAQMSAPIQPENVMQNPQMMQGTDGQIVPQNIHTENVFDAPVPQNVVNSAVPTSSEALATGIEQGVADAQPMPQPMETQANIDDVQQAIQQREAPLLSIPAYVQARQNGDLNAAAQIAQQAGANDVAQLYGMLLTHRNGQTAKVTPYAPQQNTPQAAVPVQAPVPVIGVRPNVPTKLPDNLGERRALGISLNKFMTDNKLQFAQNGRLDLVAGRGQAIRAADKKITAWEKKRAEQEARAVQNGSVHASQTAQEGAQGTQNDVHDGMLTQREMDAQNGAESVRGKSAQNQGNKKAADKGGVSEGASVSTEPESLNEPSASPSIHAPSSTSTISSEAKEKALSDNEREAVKGLSADAKNVYQMVRDKLSGMKNKKVARAASAGAVLLARHADIIARKVRATLGTPFTAMDYYRTWFDLQYGDAEKPYGGFTQKQVETQKDAVRKQYEGTAYWMKAPNGADTNLTEDQWLAVRTLAFKAWFGDWENDPKNASKVIDENGEPKVVYHGTKRKDRVGSVFRKDRATSGPMAFFTDLYDIAENYSRNKQDTSIDNPPYEEQFRIKNLHGDMPLHVKWRALSPAKQQEITEKASHVTQDDDGNIVYDEDIDYGIGNFKYEIKEFRGNAIRALEEDWLNGGTLFGEEERFLEVLKLAGVDGKEFEGMFYTDPNGSDEGVFHVFMDMKKPFDTSKDITKGFMRSLRAAAKKAPKQQYENGVDFWDKNALEPMEFVERVERDIENGTTHAWTAIPDWVTALLQKKGYDGIRDTGGKNGGVEHTVYIPFESNQIKSVDNNGAFSPNDVNIFNQSAWHGSPYDFREFLLEMIGTGEGAQAHGWGLYTAQDRAVSEEYKEHLKENHKTLYTMLYDGKPIADAPPEVQQALQALEDNAHDVERMGAAAVIARERKWHVREKENWDGIVAEFDRPLALYEENPKVSMRELRASVPKHSNAGMTIDAAKPSEKGKRRTAADVVRALNMYRVMFVGYARKEEVAIRALDSVDPEKVHLDVKRPVGKLYHVEIPDNDVLLDEQKPFDEQSKFVQEKLAELYGKESTEEYLNRIFENPYNDPALRIKFVTFKSVKRNIEQDAENAALLRDVLDRTKSPKERTSIFRDLDVYSSINPDHLVYTHSDNLQNIEASRPYLEKMLAYFEEHQRKQERLYAETLETLRGVTNPVAVLHGMNGRAIYTDLSRKCGGDKAASLALNEVGIKGITYVGGRDGRCFVVFDDKAISIIDKFNQQMNEIVKGTTQDVRDGQRIVSLFEEADESTFLHEMGHLFLLDLERLADMSPTSAQELQTVKKWATWSEGQTEEYKGTPFEAEFAYIDARIRAAIKRDDEKKAEKLKRQWEHERFARGFEMYLKHGEAPTKGLRAVFAKFRAFLQRVYQAFTGMGGRGTAEVEAVMARMISIEDSSDLSAYPQGKKTNVYTDSGKKIPVQYRIVSADDLITSHDAGALEINPGYPAALQPRDRERVMMREQVTRMANTLRPEDLVDGRNLNQGAPLIRNDGVVLNGHGRTIAIQRAQARNKERATAYRDYLVENAATFGFSKEEVESVKNPVLVREVQGDIFDVLMQDIIGSTTGGARMGASEAAQADAEKITYAMLDAYVPNDKGDLTTAANRNFVAGILHKVVGNGEMNAYLDKDGHVNADGIQRVKRALFACAYGDDELVAKMSESTDDDIRNVSNGMMSAAPMMARLSVKKGVPYVKELQDAIGAAVKQLDALRASGESVKDYLGAQALFAEHEDSAEMRAILSFLDENKRSGRRIATYFSRTAKMLDEMEVPSGNELFDTEMPSLMDVLERARGYAENGGQEGLFGDNAQEVTEIKTALVNLARAAWSDKKAQGKVSFKPSQKLRDKVRELFGHDIDEVFITADDMRHMKNAHSDGEEKRGQVNLTPEDFAEVYHVVNEFDSATKERDDRRGNQNILVVKNADGRMFALLVERGKNKAEIKTVYKYKKPSPMSDAISPNLNARSDSAKVSSISNIPRTEAEGKQEPTLEEILQLAPALKKAALEYGAKDERGKVTFADETRKQEFLKVAKVLLSAAERKTSARRQESLKEMLDGIRLIPPTRVSPRKRVLVDWGREMGVPVVFFKGDPSLHGFHQDGVTFLNVDSEITPQWTFWHEAMHWMKANNPDIYSDLVQEIRGAEGFTKTQLDAYRREIGAPNMSNADVIEEMLADALPDVKRRIPLLRDIGKRDTGLIQRLVAWIHSVMRRFHDHFYTPKGGLTSLQRRAMVRAFGNLVLSIRDAEGKPIFRVGYEGARIILHDKSPLPDVKYSQSNKAMRWIAEHPFKYDESRTMDENIQRAERLAQEYLDTFGTTDQIDTPARQQLRKQIADKLYGKGAKKKEGKVWLVLGMPASGKSTISDPIMEREGALLIDSDEAKKMLPEFSNGLLAGAVHEESSDIATNVMERAITNHDNIVWPLVGKTRSSIDEKVQRFKEAGYEVNLVYVDLPIEKAIERTKARFRHTGRLVPPRYLQSVGLKPRENYDKIKIEEGVDSYEAWNNDVARGELPIRTEYGSIHTEKARENQPHTRGMGRRGHSAVYRRQDVGAHRGKAQTDTNDTVNNTTNRSDHRGGFSMPKFSANTQEDRKGNFKWLTGAIRSFVGVAPADNLELPGRPTREQILSPKELERRIKERWIQEKNIISQEKQPDGKIKVTYYPDTHDVGYVDWIKSVRQVAKRNPFVQALYKRAHAAMKKQERLRNEFGKALKTFADLVKNPEDLKTVSTILWLGDAKGKVYTDSELRAEGASENAIKAYKLVREVLERAYKMLNDARMQVQTRSQTMAAESVETFKKNHWIKDEDVISVQPHRGGQVLLTWRGGKTYDTKDKVITAGALELMKKDDDIIVTRATPLSPTQYGEGMYEVDYVERIKPIHRLTGYMPHFFHEWMVYEKYQDPNTGQIRYTTIGSGRTMNEAVKIGNEIAAKNKDKQYVLRPKGFDLSPENSVVIGDMDFAQMTKKLAENTEMTLTDARAFLQEDAGVSLKSRHRFLGNAMKRKGAEGFDKDVMWVLAHYLNSTARYVAMEEFKPWAISMYERFFGAFDHKPPNLTAKYCQDLINDVNGNPRGVEVWLNDLIKKTWLGKHIADSFGDRVALAINGELSTWNAITKLGLFNIASAAVNFSQFINIGAALNDYGYAAQGLKRALNPSALDEKIIEASGLLDDINMADDNGGYTQRRGGKVRGIYSGVKKGGEWSLFLFQKADTLMRKAAVLGAYYQGVEQKGMKTAPGDELSAEALSYAQEINDDANFDYSSANAPNAFRLGSVVTQQLFQFQKYPIMQFEFMYNTLKNGTRGQKVRMFVPYVIFCGIGASIPFGSLFNQLFSFLFGLATGDDEDIAQEIKAEVLRWAGKDPVKKAIAETALYGVLAPTFGLDISGRIGMSNAFGGEFYGAQKPESVAGVIGQQLGGPAANSIYNMLHQFHEGNPIEAMKAVSPAFGNALQAAFGVSRTTRHRVNARYDTAYDKIAHALGFRSVDESNNAFIMNYEYEQKSKQNRTKQEAIQDYLDDPSDANRRTINALGITERQIKEARIQQERTALERATEGRPNTSRKHGASRKRKEEAKRETLYDTLDDE